MRAGFLAFILTAAVAGLASANAVAAEGTWSKGQKAAIRLIAAGVGSDGRLSGGIEIVMPAGWHTYWRTPGDAGIAPVFDFSASENVADIAVAFPIPTRLDDGFSVTNIYADRVVLPISATVVDPTKAVDLSATIELGVCAEICVPDTVTASLSIPAGDSDASAEATLARARGLLPETPGPGFAVAEIARDGGSDKRPVFRVRALVPDAGSAEVFVEGPEGWSAYLPERTDAPDAREASWTVKFSRLGATTPLEGATFRVTILSAGRAIEQTLAAN